MSLRRLGIRRGEEHTTLTRSRSRRHGAALCVLAATAVLAHDARADFDFQFATNVNGGWLRQTPSLSAPALSTSAREMDAGQVRRTGGLVLLGPSLDVDLTLDDRWKVPLLGGSLQWAAGSYDATITSFDGSITRLRPWTTFRGDLLLPGVGRRWKHRRYMLGAAVRTGVSFLKMDGSLAAGADTVPLSVSATTFLVQVEIEGCRRLDPTTRICLQVVPRIYEHELMNGVVFGLRMEWGR
jgi:hypothetical protein